MRRHATRSLETLAWTGRFAVGHLPLVVGLGAVAGAERALTQLWTAPATMAVLLEVTTWGARLVFIVAAIRIGVVADEQFRRDRVEARLNHFLVDHWPSWIVNGALLLLAFVVFSLPELWGSDLEGGERAVFFAVLLAVKNLTVIPLTFLWIVGIGRQAVLYAPKSA